MVAGADELWWYGGGVHTTTDRDEIEKFITMFHFEDEPAHGGCACGPDVEFGFERGGRSLGLFHGYLVRGVPWDGERYLHDAEAPLTDESARHVSRWFAEHGAPGPAKVVEHYLAIEEYGRVRVKRTGELLSEDFRAELEAVPDDCNVGRNEAEILRRRVPDAAARETLALRLIACLSVAGYYGAVETLDRLPLDDLRSRLRRARLDPETSFGVDCWILGHDRTRRLDNATLDEFLRPAAAHLLAETNYRAHTLAIGGLRDADHRDALVLLRELLDAPSADDRRSAAGILVFDKEDTASFPRIRELAAMFDEINRDSFFDRMTYIESRDKK